MASGNVTFGSTKTRIDAFRWGSLWVQSSSTSTA